jgi:hypothetical protein
MNNGQVLTNKNRRAVLPDEDSAIHELFETGSVKVLQSAGPVQ